MENWSAGSLIIPASSATGECRFIRDVSYRPPRAAANGTLTLSSPPNLSFLHNYLKSPSFCSRSQAENAHILRVLPLGDEFRERIGFCGSEEKFGKCLAQRVCHDKFRWRDARTNGSQPGPEGVPDKLGGNDSEILEQSLG